MAKSPLAILGKWRSGLADAIDKAPMPKARGREWVPYLDKQPHTSDEMRWTGFLEALTEKGDQRLTRNHVLELQSENPLTINETPRYQDYLHARRKQWEEIDRLKAQQSELSDQDLARLFELEQAENVDDTLHFSMRARMHDMISEPDDKSVQSGGLQYMEKTHTSPSALSEPPAHFTTTPDADKQLGAYSSTIRDTEGELEVTATGILDMLDDQARSEELYVPGGAIQIEGSGDRRTVVLYREDDQGDYLVAHMVSGTPDEMLAHIRNKYGEYIDIPETRPAGPMGEKVFRLEQIQGDRHQKGVKSGYFGDDFTEDEAEKAFEDIMSKHGIFRGHVDVPEGIMTFSREENGLVSISVKNEDGVKLYDKIDSPKNIFKGILRDYADDGIDFGIGGSTKKAPWMGRKKGVPQWLRKTFKSALYDAAQEGADVFEAVSGGMINREGNPVYDQMLPRLFWEEAKRLGIELPNSKKAVKLNESKLRGMFIRKIDKLLGEGPDVYWSGDFRYLLRKKERIPELDGEDLLNHFRGFISDWDFGPLNDAEKELFRGLEQHFQPAAPMPYQLPLTPEIRKRIIEEGVPVAMKKGKTYA